MKFEFQITVSCHKIFFFLFFSPQSFKNVKTGSGPHMACRPICQPAGYRTGMSWANGQGTQVNVPFYAHPTILKLFLVSLPHLSYHCSSKCQACQATKLLLVFSLGLERYFPVLLCYYGKILFLFFFIVSLLNISSLNINAFIFSLFSPILPIGSVAM